jgi:hypothetical protein
MSDNSPKHQDGICSITEMSDADPDFRFWQALSERLQQSVSMQGRHPNLLYQTRQFLLLVPRLVVSISVAFIGSCRNRPVWRWRPNRSHRIAGNSPVSRGSCESVRLSYSTLVSTRRSENMRRTILSSSRETCPQRLVWMAPVS